MTKSLFLGLVAILTTGNGQLMCDPLDDDFILDIIAAMVDKGYELETGYIEYANYDSSDTSSRDFVIPFVNRDSRYGGSVFSSNGQNAARMSGQDILLWRGCTPPNVTYYSYRSYTSVRVTAQDASGLTLENKQASLGDSTNNQVIVTERCPECAGTRGQNSFDDWANIATTGDATSFAELQEVYEDLGLGADVLNLESIPSEANFVWSQDILTVPRDALLFLFRVVNNGDVSQERQDLLAEYRNQTQPFYLFRKIGTTEPRVPIAKEFRKVKVPYFLSENTFQTRPDFEAAVSATKRYGRQQNWRLVGETELKQRQGTVTDADGEERGAYIFAHGLKCLELNLDCILDNRDTHYSWDGTSYTLDDNDIFLVVGLNHNLFDMTTYNSLGAYYVVDPTNPELIFTPLPEPDGSIIDDEYEAFDINDVVGGGKSGQGSRRFEKTFVVSVSRPSNCLSDIMASLCPSTDKLAEGDPFVLFARAHLNPQTGTLPQAEQLIPWRLLHFRTD